jgi:hypothetical protein
MAQSSGQRTGKNGHVLQHSDEETGLLVDKTGSDDPGKQDTGQDKKTCPTTMVFSSGRADAKSPRSLSHDFSATKISSQLAKYASRGCPTVCRRICFFLFVFLLVAWIALRILQSFGNSRLGELIEDIGTNITGVPVRVNSARIDAMAAQTKLHNFTVFNPKSCPSAPYFVNFGSIVTKISWRTLWTWFSHLVILRRVTLSDAIVYIDSEVLLTNYDIIMQHIAASAMYRYTNQHQRFIIEEINVVNTTVHTILSGNPLAVMPPIPFLQLTDVGAEQHGLPLEKLREQLAGAFAAQALFAPKIAPKTGLAK